MKQWSRLLVAALVMALLALPGRALATASDSSTTPPPTVPGAGPVATNDLLPNDVNNCVGTVERANCGSKARADGHTYLVFAVLAAGLAFIGWRIGRGLRARNTAQHLAG